MPWGAGLFLASYLQFSGAGIPWDPMLFFGADMDPKGVPGVGTSVAPALGGGNPPQMEFPCLLCRASSAATGILTVHKAKLFKVLIAFPPDFLFNHFNFGCVFDSFYLLSHHSSSWGAASD